MQQKWQRQLGLLVLAILAVLWLSLPAWASARLESRVSRLEFDLNRVRSQLEQIEAQLNTNRPQPAPQSPRIPAPISDPSLEAQFDNLAILSIELKQDIQRLEQRVDDLESAVF